MWKQILRFGMVGVMATFVHMVIGFLLIQSNWQPLTANMLAFAIAFLVSFVGHLGFSFAEQDVIAPDALWKFAEGNTEKVSGSMVFDANAAESLMDRIRTSISVGGLEGYLNCNRVQAQQLVRTSILPRLLPEGSKAMGAMKGIARDSADEFLGKLMQAAESVAVASDGMLDIIAAAEVSRWPAMDIVRGILSGLFTKVEVVKPELKFKGILVDPVEVRMTLKRNQLKGCVGIEEAVQLIGMPQQGLNNLVRMRNADGEPYISERMMNNAKGVPVRLFALDEIEAFRRDHISLTEIAEAESCYPKIMKVKLDDRGYPLLLWRRADDRHSADHPDA